MEARTHAGSCVACQERHPNAITFLSNEIGRLETALALEVEEIRGDHIREASAIGRNAILSRPDAATFPLDDALLDSQFHGYEETGSESTPALELITSLAKAGARIKRVFATIHGEGLAWFNVVVNLNNDDEEYAWKECAGLVQRLSKESREFAFSASLAAEVLPDLAWRAWRGESELLRLPSGVQLGVLYKAIQAAGSRYAETYLMENSETPTIQPTESEAIQLTQSLPMVVMKNEDSQKIEHLLDGQTAMMGSMTEMERALRKLLEDYRRADDEQAKRRCEATLRDALGLQFDGLAEPTRRFLLAAEYNYSHFPVDLDFYPVAVGLMKAFESEFHRTIEPFFPELQKIAITDTSFKQILPRCSLGGFNRLFQKHRSTVEPLFQRHGLFYRDICNAITSVNHSKQAKHLAAMTKADATRFRALFLDRPSVLTALLPNR